MPQTPKIIHAHWETSNRGIVVLARDWPDRGHPPLYVQPGSVALESLKRALPMVFGQKSGYCMMHGKLVFMLCPEQYPNLNWHGEAVYVAGDFNGWQQAIGQKQWLMKAEKIDGRPYLVLRIDPKAVISGNKGSQFKFVTELSHWQDVPANALNRVADKNGIYNLELNPARTGHHMFYFYLDGFNPLLDDVKLSWGKGPRAKVCSISFQLLLLQCGTERTLGAQPQGEQTIFSLFAPRATRVTVTFWRERGGQLETSLELTPCRDGVWEAQYPENLHGYYYYYQIDGQPRGGYTHFDYQQKVLDPYARAAVSREGPGIILDPEWLPQTTKPFVPPAWHDLVIMEAHVRDLVTYAPLALNPSERRGFTGLAKWVAEKGGYLKALGVNAVELQPIQEFDSPTPAEYHWGYMPVNYFSPDSSYALDPEQATQVHEFRHLVDTFHKQGMAVILDVVYNHIGEPNPLLFIDKNYYLEINPEGDLMNWSGCGNDFRAHTPMGRRLIIDSLRYLVETYDVDGFRFDLAELIGVDVLQDVARVLKTVKPSIILIAEPWSFRGHIGHALKNTCFSSWNDGYRDFMRDYVLGRGNHDGLEYFIRGSLGHLTNWPAQSVNYVESHDDYAWLDRITEKADHNGFAPTALDRRRTHLMFSLLMMSFGIPMLAAGQDFLRSKHGEHNTYQKPELNALDYNRATLFPNTQRYCRAWLHFRQSPLGHYVRLDQCPTPGYTRSYRADGASSIAILYNQDNSRGPEQLLYAINPHDHWQGIGLDSLVAENFKQIADHEMLDAEGLALPWLRWEHGELQLPPHSCGLWVRTLS